MDGEASAFYGLWPRVAEAPLDPPLLDGDATIFAFRRNVVVAASAGTGKTHRLTALYVLLTLGLTSMGQRDDRSPAASVGPERIVATTFSRAAALEISIRIERALRDIAAWDGARALAFDAEIRGRESMLGEPLSAAEMRGRAEAALARWPSAKIDTLHGVARRVVQRHALAVGIPPGARVLDEEEAQSLGDLAVDEALGAALGEGGERAEAARALIATAGGVGSVRRQVLRLIDRLDEEGLAPRDLVLADHLAEARAAASSLRRVAAACAATGHASLRDPAAALAAILAAAPADTLLPERGVAVLSDLLTRRMPARGRRTAADDALDDLIGELPGKTKGERAAALAALLRHAPELGAREARLVDLLEDARRRLGVAKRRAGGLGFGDLLRIARDTLRDRLDLARAVREDIGVLMVDEFQDTSRVQRDLVYLLRERDDAAELRPAGGPPTAAGLEREGLFLVGDRKQSIYGFRGADVAVFSRVCAELAGRAAGEALALPDEIWIDAGAPVADFVALRESRRSSARVLAFVNAFSSRDFEGGRAAPGAAPRDFEITYGPAEHLVPVAPDPAAAPPISDVVLVRDDGASPEHADPIVRESSGAAREAHVAAAYVASLARDPARRVLFRDVAVLARRRSTIPLVELALGRLDIPYVVAGRALYDAPEVRDVAALLRLLLDPRDRLALATVLRGPMVALSDTSLASLSLPGRGLSVPLLGRWPGARAPAAARSTPAAATSTLLSFGAPAPSSTPATNVSTWQPSSNDVIEPSRLPFAERARLEAFRARFAELRRAALRLPPGEAIRASVAAFDLDRVLAALPRAEARIGNLDRLVTIARRRAGTLAAFVRWLERRIRDEADEAEAAVFSPEDDAVRLTTIHASKGLDFPVVVLVDLNAEPRAEYASLGFLASAARDGAPPTLVTRHYVPRPDRPESNVLVALSTATLKASQADARAREQAERRRLTYVAITRAKHTLALIGAATKPRNASAFRSLEEGLTEGDLVDAVTSTLPALALLAEARPLPPRAPPPGAERPLAHAADARPPARPARSPARTLAIATGPLALFRDCARRYRLRHLVGLAEPATAGQLDLFSAAAPPPPIDDLPPPIAGDPALDPRPLHRAPHRVLACWPLSRWGKNTDPREIALRLAALGHPLESADTARLARAIATFLEGPYARALRDSGAAITRDEAFAIDVAAGGSSPRRLSLSGTIDLRVAFPDGRVDVIEHRPGRTRADLAPHDLALRARALWAHRRSPGARVRSGVLFLGVSAEPTWLRGAGPDGALADRELAAFEKDLAALAHRFADARWDDRFDGEPIATCQRLRCGFVQACHTDARARS